MDWDEEEEPLDAVATRASRPGRSRRLNDRTVVADRSPQTQTEIQRRVAVYAQQIEQQGFFDWLPPPLDED